MSSTKNSDVTAKRPSETEEEATSSLMKKPRVEEKVDVNMESESESESDSDGEFDAEAYEAEANAKAAAEGRLRDGILTYVPEPEPEWDVDSYDGLEYVSNPKTRGFFDNEDDYVEYRNGRIEAIKNRGFLPDPIKYISPILNLDDPSGRIMTTGETTREETTREYLEDLVSLCVKKLNEEKVKTVEFVSLVRSNMKGGSRFKLYITFMAREYPNGPLVEYQAKTMDFVGGVRPPFPILCRPAHVNP